MRERLELEDILELEYGVIEKFKEEVAKGGYFGSWYAQAVRKHERIVELLWELRERRKGDKRNGSENRKLCRERNGGNGAFSKADGIY